MNTNVIQKFLRSRILYSVVLLILVSLTGCSGVGNSHITGYLQDDHHIWVVDEQGKPTSLEGVWKMESITPASELRSIVGEIHEFPNADSDVAHFTFDGIYRAFDGKLWTKVKVGMKNRTDYYLLERLERGPSRETLHIVEAIDNAGNFLEKYPDDLSDTNHISYSIWVKQ